MAEKIKGSTSLSSFLSFNNGIIYLTNLKLIVINLGGEQ